MEIIAKFCHLWITKFRHWRRFSRVDSFGCVIDFVMWNEFNLNFGASGVLSLEISMLQNRYNLKIAEFKRFCINASLENE